MTRAIWKYTLPAPHTRLAIREPGIVRHVAWQHGEPTLWIEVDPDDSRGDRDRRFEVVATGERFDPSQELGTVYHGSCVSDALVFHVFEFVQAAR